MPYVAVYATVAEFQADTAVPSNAAEVARALEAASRNIDTATGQRFGLSDAAEARLYDPPYAGRTLPVDPIDTLTSIKSDEDRDGSFADETAWTSSEYELLPLNADGEPQHFIHVPAWSTRAPFLPGTRIEVTAVFGWSSVPAGVAEAAIEWAKLLLMQGPRATLQVSTLDEVERVSPDASRMLRRLLDPYYTQAAVSF